MDDPRFVDIILSVYKTLYTDNQAHIGCAVLPSLQDMVVKLNQEYHADVLEQDVFDVLFDTRCAVHYMGRTSFSAQAMLFPEMQGLRNPCLPEPQHGVVIPR